MTRKPQAALWLMLAPFLVGSVALVVVPVALTFPLALLEYDGIATLLWRGTWNFHLIWSDPAFRAALDNSLWFVALAVPLRVLGAFGLALLLQHRRRGAVLYRTAVFLPTIVPDVAYALVWLWIFNPLFGPLNILLGTVGLRGPAWLVDPNTALLAIVLMSLFQIGEGFVLLLAALRHVPQDFYEAGAIAGAGPWRLFRTVTLPLVAPWLLLLAIRDIAVTAQSTFVAAYMMTGGGPYYATLFLPLLIEEEAFHNLRFGDAAAMMTVLFAYVAVLLLLVFVTMRGWSFRDDA